MHEVCGSLSTLSPPFPSTSSSSHSSFISCTSSCTSSTTLRAAASLCTLPKRVWTLLTTPTYSHHRCTVSFVVPSKLRFSPEGPDQGITASFSTRTLLLCSSERFSDCLLSRKRNIASSLGGDEDSDGGRMRLKGEEAIRSFLTDDAISSSTALFLEKLRCGHVLLSVSASIPQETLNFQYFWVEQDLSVHQIPTCDFRSDHVAPLFPPDSFVWTRNLSRCPDISATLDRLPRCFHQWLEVLGESHHLQLSQ